MCRAPGPPRAAPRVSVPRRRGGAPSPHCLSHPPLPPGVAGSCGGWAASSSPGRRQERTRVFQNTPPSVHGELLLETSNFTDHGFGGKNVTPEVSGKLFTPGEMEMSRQMGQAPYWIPGRFTQRPAQPAPPPPSAPLSPSHSERWGSWEPCAGSSSPGLSHAASHARPSSLTPCMTACPSA